MSCRNRMSRLKTASFNVRTPLLIDDEVQEEEEQFRATRFAMGVIGVGEVRTTEECFRT